MARKLLQSTATVGGMTFVSRVLGFVRDVVIARFFGAGIGTDAFFVAFKIPNFLRRLFAEGAFNHAFVPVFSEYHSQRSHDELKALTDRVCGTLAAILLLVTVAGVAAAPVLVTIFAPGFTGDEERFALTVDMLRLTFPYLLFISLTAMAGGILNSLGRFAIPALTPALLNLTLIGAAVWLAPLLNQPVTALAWGVLAAGAVQLAFQLPFLARHGLLPIPRWGWVDTGVRRVLRLMLPGVFGSSVAQINLLIDTVLASFLVAGSVSWLYYSDRLVEFPLGVFGIALATVLLPSLSRHHAETDPAGFAVTLDWALRWVVLIGTPATVGLVMLAEPLLTTLFQYGAFSPEDVTMAGQSLMAYGAGLLPFILVKVLAPGFFARQDTRTPVIFGAAAMVVNMVLSIALVFPLAHAGLALATSLAAFTNAGLLFHRLRRDGVFRPQPGWPALLLRVGAACAVMALLLAWGSGDTAAWLERDAIGRAAHLAGWIIAAGTGYFLVVAALGMRPAHLRTAA